MSVLNETEDAANPDQNTACVERVQTTPPQTIDLHALRGWHTQQTSVEDPGDDDEAAEEKDLDDKTADDDVLSGRHGAQRATRHDTATC